MTVTELIEALQNLSGDPDLRTVRLMVEVSRPYGQGAQMIEGGVYGVAVKRDVAVVEGVIYME